MPRVLAATLWVFLAITASSALLAIGGVAWLWFSASASETPKDLPYLKPLLSSVVFEVAGVIFLLARRGLRYLPQVITHKQESATLEFMQRDPSNPAIVRSLRCKSPVLDVVRDVA